MLVATVVGMFLLVATGGLIVLGLGLTEAGTRLLARGVERISGVELESVAGTLARDLRIGRLVIRLDAGTLEVADLLVRPELARVLFDDRIVLDEVRVGSIVWSPDPIDDLPEVDPAAGPWESPLLPIDVEVRQFDLARLVLPAIPELAIHGAASWSMAGLMVDRLVISDGAAEIALSGTLGTGVSPEVAIALQWSLPVAGVSGSGSLAGQLDRLAVTQRIEGAYAADLSGWLNLARPAAPVADLALASEGLVLGTYPLERLDARLVGGLDALRVEAQARGSDPSGQPAELTVTLAGPAAGPYLVNAEARLLGGEAAGTGTLALAPAARFDGVVTARQLKLETLLPGHAGQLDAEVGLAYAGSSMSLEVRKITGTADGFPISGRGRLEGGPGGGWSADSVELRVGENVVQLSGRLDGSRVSLAASLSAPRLDQIEPGLEGALTGAVDISGEWPALVGSARVSAERLSRSGSELRDLELELAMARSGRLDGRLEVASLDTPVAGLSGLALALEGTPEAFDWQLRWVGGAAAGLARLSADELGLELERLTFELEGQRVATTGPGSLRFAAGQLDIAPLCLSGAEFDACVDETVWSGDRWVSAGRVDRLPFRLVAGLLPIDLDEAGSLSGHWSISGAPAAWQGTATVASHALVIRVPALEDERFELPDARLDLTLASSAINFVLEADGIGTTIHGEGGISSPDPQGTLSGMVEISLADIGWLAALDERLQEVGGSVTGRLELGGTLGAPSPIGRIAWEHGSLVTENPGFRLESASVRADVDGSGALRFSGSGASDGGSLTIEGSGSGVLSGAPMVEARLVGAGLRSTDPQWTVVMSPRLDFGWRDGVGQLAGEVLLSKIDLELKSLPSNVPQPSADVVVVGRTAVPSELAGNPLRLDLAIRLGEDVRLRTLGLDARLGGEVRVRRRADGQMSVRGTLDVTGGVIKAQGTTLAIESGLVVYSGAPGNPFVDVRAVREVATEAAKVKVGIHFSGTPGRFSSELFSEPPMEENRVLSFLVLGRDLDSKSTGDSGALLAAAINLGLKKSSSLTAAMQNALKLDELGAAAEGQDNFSLSAGKEISDGLYLRYVYNTLSAAGSVLISFDLTDHWRLEGSSGTESAMDILYRINR